MTSPMIFIACDTTSTNKIKKIIKLSQGSKLKFGYKFGLEFLNSKNGRKFISNLKNKITFGDYKLADIPNTCASSIRAVKDLKLNYISIHISSGLQALKAAKKVSGKTKLIGVTILTSLDNKSLKEIGFEKDVKKLVLQQAELATKANLDAIVCSPHEIKIVRRFFKKEIITPGIRLSGDSEGDQKRVMTPKQAFQNGATALVMGRSLTGNIKKISKNLSENLINMRIKVCGLHPVRDVQLCIDLKINFLGFIFYERSPRNINLGDVRKLKIYDKKNTFFTAVTVNPTNDFIKNVILENFDYIQLHGSETTERVEEIKSMGLKIIKAIKIKDQSDIKTYKKYENADIILFDTPGMEKSIEFPKSLISKLPKGKKYALAGSISQNNIENIAKLGVSFCDLSSSLESDTQIGYKDHQKIKKFIKKVNELKN